MNPRTLVTAFSKVNGSSFVGIDTLTNVPLLGGQKNQYQGRITKRMTDARVMVFQNKLVNGYESMIVRRLINEGKDPTSFSLDIRPWGVRIPNMPIIEYEAHGEKRYYLEVIFLSSGRIEYILDGTTVIAESRIPGFVTAPPPIQDNLSNKVIIRTFAADSIIEVRINGRKYN